MSGQALKVTDKAPDGHYHIVYVDSGTGVGALSAPIKSGKAIPQDHANPHQLIYDPPREPVEPTPAMIVDPMSGQQQPAPEDPQEQQLLQSQGYQIIPANPGDPGKEVGEWIIGPGGDEQSDMHQHEIQEYRPQKKEEEKEEDHKIIAECMELWKEALAITRDCRKKGKESEDFYKGKQWDDETERWLTSLDRAALVINEVAPNIDMLIGYQMEQRTDFRFLPRGEGGDQRVADMLNITVKQICDSCSYPREETKVFKDACVPGMGVFNVYMDFVEEIRGNLKIERFPWYDCVYGPHEKEDLSDCEYEVRSRMYSMAWLEMFFGKKAKEIRESFKLYSGQYPDPGKENKGISGTNTDYNYAEKIDDLNFTVDGTVPLIDIQKKQFRLVQVTRKIYKEITVIFNHEENFFFTAYDWKDEDIAAASTLPGFQVISQMKPRMRVTKFCGSVVLSDENPAKLPLHDFYTVPVYAYRQDGEYWGKVEIAKDPQREINKRRSQIMDTMNRMGASIYYTEADTFTEPGEEERFRKNRSKPGSTFRVSDITRKPVLEEGAQLPSGVVQIMQMDQENLQRLMNVYAEQQGANESGMMLLEKKKSKLTGNQFIFDNLSFAKQKLGKIIVALVQKYYDAERLERLLSAKYSKSKFKIGEEDYGSFSKQEIVDMLECSDLTEYDVVITESSFAPSTRLAIAQMLFEAIQKGMAIPPELPLRFIDMPADIRSEITDQMKAQAEAQAQSQADTNNSEIKKTAIATGNYTISQEEAQNLGLVPVNNPENPLANSAQAPNNEQDTQTMQYADNLASSLAG